MVVSMFITANVRFKSVALWIDSILKLDNIIFEVSSYEILFYLSNTWSDDIFFHFSLYIVKMNRESISVDWDLELLLKYYLLSISKCKENKYLSFPSFL